MLEEQRQVELDARRGQPFADAAIDIQARDIAAKAQPEAAAELAHRLGIERQLARRQQLQRFDRLLRALRLRVEAAQRVDLIVEQIDAHRRVACPWATRRTANRAARTHQAR